MHLGHFHNAFDIFKSYKGLSPQHGNFTSRKISLTWSLKEFHRNVNFLDILYNCNNAELTLIPRLQYFLFQGAN